MAPDLWVSHLLDFGPGYKGIGVKLDLDIKMGAQTMVYSTVRAWMCTQKEM